MQETLDLEFKKRLAWSSGTTNSVILGRFFDITEPGFPL